MIISFDIWPSPTLPSRTRKVQTTEDANEICVLGIEKHAQTYVTRLYLPNLLGTLDRDGNADSNMSGGEKSSWDKLFQAISVEKRL